MDSLALSNPTDRIQRAGTVVKVNSSGQIVVTSSSGTLLTFYADATGLSMPGQLQLTTGGSTGGLLLGGDTNLYRLNANILKTDGALIVNNGITITGSIANNLVNGQAFSITSLTELTTINAAGSTATTIQIPVNAVVFAVSVRVTVVIPTAATFTVTGTTSGTTFNTAAVSTAAGSTDTGTATCPYKNGAAQTITITPNFVPADNSGRVRVTIHYYVITPPTS